MLAVKGTRDAIASCAVLPPEWLPESSEGGGGVWRQAVLMGGDGGMVHELYIEVSELQPALSAKGVVVGRETEHIAVQSRWERE